MIEKVSIFKHGIRPLLVFWTLKNQVSIYNYQKQTKNANIYMKNDKMRNSTSLYIEFPILNIDKLLMKVLHSTIGLASWQICTKIFFFSLQSEGIIFLRCFVNLIRLMCWFASGLKLYVCKLCWFSGKNKIIFHDWLHFFARVLTCKMGSKSLQICIFKNST